jgi:hypothetical protein
MQSASGRRHSEDCVERLDVGFGQAFAGQLALVGAERVERSLEAHPSLPLAHATQAASAATMTVNGQCRASHVISPTAPSR